MFQLTLGKEKDLYLLSVIVNLLRFKRPRNGEKKEVNRKEREVQRLLQGVLVLLCDFDFRALL